jgi:hypothetical protein
MAVARRAKVAISIKKTSYTIEELADLLFRLEHEAALPEEIARRQKLLDEADRFREAMPPITADVKDWIREERGE